MRRTKVLMQKLRHWDRSEADACRALIAEGINLDERVETTESVGRTALMLAALRGSTEVVQELVRAGAALDLKNQKGKTALQLAQDKGHSNVVEILRGAAATTATATIASTQRLMGLRE